MKVKKIVLWYSKEWRSWGVLKYDAEGNNIGENIWVYTKREAMDEKKALEKKYGLKKR